MLGTAFFLYVQTRASHRLIFLPQLKVFHYFLKRLNRSQLLLFGHGGIQVSSHVYLTIG